MNRPKWYENDYDYSCYRDGYKRAQKGAADRLYHLSLARGLDGEAMREACAREAGQLKKLAARSS